MCLSTTGFGYGSDRRSSLLLIEFCLCLSTALNFYLAGPGGNGLMTATAACCVVSTAAAKRESKNANVKNGRRTRSMTEIQCRLRKVSTFHSHNRTNSFLNNYGLQFCLPLAAVFQRRFLVSAFFLSDLSNGRKWAASTIALNSSYVLVDVTARNFASFCKLYKFSSLTRP